MDSQTKNNNNNNTQLPKLKQNPSPRGSLPLQFRSKNSNRVSLDLGSSRKHLKAHARSVKRTPKEIEESFSSKRPELQAQIQTRKDRRSHRHGYELKRSESCHNLLFQRSKEFHAALLMCAKEQSAKPTELGEIFPNSWDYHPYHFDEKAYKRKKEREREKSRKQKERRAIEMMQLASESEASLSTSFSWISDFSKRNIDTMTNKTAEDTSSLSSSSTSAELPTNLSTTPHQTTGLELEQGIIVGGIPDSLVGSLAHFHFSNNEYITEFLFSYRAFMESHEVLKKLIERFVDVDEKLLFSEQTDREQMIWFVRLRVIKVLKVWLQDFYFDFYFDKELFKTLKRFVHEIMPKEFEKYSIQLKCLIQEKHSKPVYQLTEKTPTELIEATMRRVDSKLNSRVTRYKDHFYQVHTGDDIIQWLSVNLPNVMRGQAVSMGELLVNRKLLFPLNPKRRGFRAGNDEFYRLSNAQNIQLPPKPIVPKKIPLKLKFLDIDPREFARQITLFSSKIFHDLTPRELMNPDWYEKRMYQKAPNAITLFDHFNKIACWVTTEIVLTSGFHQRVKLLERFILVAHECIRLENYLDSNSITSGLVSAAVGRLKRTWAEIGAKYQKMYTRIEQFTPAYQKNLREAHKRAVAPAIPNFALMMGDLIRLKESPSRLQNGYINFHKYRVEAQIFSEMQRLKQKAYPFKPVAEYQNFIKEELLLIQDEKKLFNHSLECEPRGASAPQSTFHGSLMNFFNKKEEK